MRRQGTGIILPLLIALSCGDRPKKTSPQSASDRGFEPDETSSSSQPVRPVDWPRSAGVFIGVRKLHDNSDLEIGDGDGGSRRRKTGGRRRSARARRRASQLWPRAARGVRGVAQDRDREGGRYNARVFVAPAFSGAFTCDSHPARSAGAWNLDIMQPVQAAGSVPEGQPKVDGGKRESAQPPEWSMQNNPPRQGGRARSAAPPGRRSTTNRLRWLRAFALATVYSLAAPPAQ
jgi:hypothetical protein